MQRLLILDVDGVVFPHRAWRATEQRAGTGGWPDWRRVMRRPRAAEGGRVPLKLSREMGTRIAALCEATGTRIWWLTTWQDQALEYVAPQLGVAEHTDGAIQWWDRTSPLRHGEKAAALGRWLAGREQLPGAVVWADDELREGGVLDASRGVVGNPLAELGVAHLLVGCDPLVGLSTDDVDRAERFLASASG